MDTTNNTSPWLFFLYNNAFHNGGLISKHHTYDAAIRALRKRQKSMQAESYGMGCRCGCADIVARDESGLGEQFIALENLRGYEGPDETFFVVTETLETLKYASETNSATLGAL